MSPEEKAYRAIFGETVVERETRKATERVASQAAPQGHPRNAAAALLEWIKLEQAGDWRPFRVEGLLNNLDLIVLALSDYAQSTGGEPP